MPRKRKVTTPTPNLHFLMIVTVAFLTALCLLVYPFVPNGRDTVYVGVITTLVGFLGGKFSNSFGKSLDVKTPTVEAAPIEDEEESE